MIQFLRDLALVPAMWRRAVAAERARRFSASPAGLIAYEDRMLLSCADDPVLTARLKASAPSGRWGDEIVKGIKAALDRYDSAGHRIGQSRQ